MAFTTIKMLMSLFIVFAILAVATATPEWTRIKARQEKYEQNLQSKNDLPDIEKVLMQRLDHFDRSINTQFKQRYFVNTTFWNGDANSAVFLCVGGEGPPLDRTIFTSSVHCMDMVTLAPKHNALMLALEHRYYGPSNPFGRSYKTDEMRWLNTEQALGDIAFFVNHINEEYSLKSTNQWVTWGGSYPGMVAALARYRFPHLITAAVSSSAPLQAQVDMEGYNNVVASSMAAASVGGSQACLNTVIDGHAVIGEQLQTAEGRKNLEKTFNFCVPGNLEDPKNREQFAGDGVVYLPVQSNDPACSSAYCDINSICQLLTNETLGDSVARLAALSSAQSTACKTVSYDAMTQFWSNSTNPDRTWLYQTCTEWGFYQTCNTGSSCPYTQGLHTVNVDLDLCAAAFDISPVEVNQQIQQALNTYGGSNLQATKIMYVNAEIDPWHANSVLTPPVSAAESPVYWVNGASHHFWTHPILSTDSEDVNKARQAIWTQVDAWLAEGSKTKQTAKKQQ